MPKRRHQTGPRLPQPLVSKTQACTSPQTKRRMSLSCKWKFFAQCLLTLQVSVKEQADSFGSWAPSLGADAGSVTCGKTEEEVGA